MAPFFVARPQHVLKTLILTMKRKEETNMWLRGHELNTIYACTSVESIQAATWLQAHSMLTEPNTGSVIFGLFHNSSRLLPLGVIDVLRLLCTAS